MLDDKPEWLNTAARAALCTVDITERLVRIETKVDTLIEHSADHEVRMRSLEREQWIHRGGIAVITFIAAKIGLPWVTLG